MRWMCLTLLTLFTWQCGEQSLDKQVVNSDSLASKQYTFKIPRFSVIDVSHQEKIDVVTFLDSIMPMSKVSEQATTICLYSLMSNQSIGVDNEIRVVYIKSRPEGTDTSYFELDEDNKNFIKNYFVNEAHMALVAKVFSLNRINNRFLDHMNMHFSHLIRLNNHNVFGENDSWKGYDSVLLLRMLFEKNQVRKSIALEILKQYCINEEITGFEKERMIIWRLVNREVGE